MNHESLSQIVFEQKIVVFAHANGQPSARPNPAGLAVACAPGDAVETSRLIGLLESACRAEVQPFLDTGTEAVVCTAVRCRHAAALPSGTLLRIRGWVEGLGEREVTFRVDAFDDSEEVCEGAITLAFVARAEFARRWTRKCETIGRRELFLAA